VIIELDHVFLWVSRHAPEADHLVRFGLTEGTPNHHPGQGTANRRFFFHNGMIELLWVEDEGEARNELTLPTQLWDRWSHRDRGASPFGICVRPVPGNEASPPFPVWDYRPQYLPYPLAIQIAAGTPLHEPFIAFMSFVRRPDSASDERRQPLDHPIGFGEISAVRIASPILPVSPAAQSIANAGVASFAPGPCDRMELTFDGGVRGRFADFSPDLPLVARW
jgi:hypothetical protein